MHQISVYTMQVKYCEIHGLVEMTLKLDLQGQISRSNVIFCCFFAVFYHFSCLDIPQDVYIDVNFAKLITYDNILGIFKECFCSHNVLLG